MKKLILILSSVFLSINVYSQTFRENLDRTTNYIDSMCDYSRSLYYNNSGMTSIFLEKKKRCLVTNPWGTFILDGYCYINGSLLLKIEYPDGDLFMNTTGNGTLNGKYGCTIVDRILKVETTSNKVYYIRIY